MVEGGGTSDILFGPWAPDNEFKPEERLYLWVEDKDLNPEKPWVNPNAIDLPQFSVDRAKYRDRVEDLLPADGTGNVVESTVGSIRGISVEKPDPARKNKVNFVFECDVVHLPESKFNLNNYAHSHVFVKRDGHAITEKFHREAKSELKQRIAAVFDTISLRSPTTIRQAA